ncbi:MAG: hypothetical protein LKK00_07090 [Intestinimonas sp.]|jgi:hypothetical protein|nr:hypothetical protein [Intestinimonas sp.]
MRLSYQNRVWRLLRLLFLLVGLPAVLYTASGVLSSRVHTQALVLTEQSVRRAAVQCYALEGAYPITLDVLTKHYGVSIDETRYFVDYRYVASNLMPEITVLPRS